MKPTKFYYYDSNHDDDDEIHQFKFITDKTDPANSKSAILWITADYSKKGIMIERQHIQKFDYDEDKFNKVMLKCLNLIERDIEITITI